MPAALQVKVGVPVAFVTLTSAVPVASPLQRTLVEFIKFAASVQPAGEMVNEQLSVQPLTSVTTTV